MTREPRQSRARPCSSSEREERVRTCMALMPHAWERGKTAKRLAEAAGEGIAVWETASAEAWRRINAQDVGWVREHLCHELLQALEDAKTIDEIKDRVKSIVEVAKAWAPLVGVVQASSVTVEATQGQQQNVFRIEVSNPEKPT